MFKLTDPFGTAPSQAPFEQSISTGVPWHNLPITREYTLGQLLDQTIARCGENDFIQSEGRALETEYAMSNNFAFGGVNTSLVFRRV